MEKGIKRKEYRAEQTFSVSELPKVISLLKALKKPLVINWAAISLYMQYKHARFD